MGVVPSLFLTARFTKLSNQPGLRVHYMIGDAPDSWTSKADMPTPSVALSASAVNGKVFNYTRQRHRLHLQSKEGCTPYTHQLSALDETGV